MNHPKQESDWNFAGRKLLFFQVKIHLVLAINLSCSEEGMEKFNFCLSAKFVRRMKTPYTPLQGLTLAAIETKPSSLTRRHDDFE